jgi:hypothetical protein
MGINNNAPIQLHPELNRDMMSSYINENFRKIYKGFNPLQISDGSNERILIGKYGTDSYGIVVSDTNGDKRILIGAHPTLGQSGIWVSKEGIDVIDELSA